MNVIKRNGSVVDFQKDKINKSTEIISVLYFFSFSNLNKLNNVYKKAIIDIPILTISISDL